MPHSAVWKERGLYLSFFDAVSFDEILSANFKLFSDARFEDLDFFITDTTDITTLTFPSHKIDMPAAMDSVGSSYTNALKGAFVIQAPEIYRTMERYISVAEKLGTHWTLQIFTTCEEAQAWVNS